MVSLCVCIGSSCHTNGGYNVTSTFRHLIEHKQLHDEVELSTGLCAHQCSRAGVAVTVNGVTTRIAPEEARTFFAEQVEPLCRR